MFYEDILIIWDHIKTSPLPDDKLYTSKLKEFADNSFKFDENESKLSKQVENCGKNRNCSLRAISPFLTVFSKGLFPRGVTLGVIVWEWVSTMMLYLISQT